MKVDLYSASVGVFGRGLNGLTATLARGAAFATANGLSEAELLAARLHPTMYPLHRQAQIACDVAGQAPARIAGLPVPATLESESATLAELQAQIAAIKAFHKTLAPAQFEGRDAVMIDFPVGGEPARYQAAQYLVGFATQTFFFHMVMAYAILRNLGVDLGKKDYFGS